MINTHCTHVLIIAGKGYDGSSEMGLKDKGFECKEKNYIPDIKKGTCI